MTDKRRSDETADGGGGRTGDAKKEPGPEKPPKSRRAGPGKAAAKKAGPRKTAAKKTAAKKTESRKAPAKKAGAATSAAGQAGPKPAEPRAAEGEAAAGEQGSVEADRPSARPSKGLPAFGFAEDLLSSRDERDGDPERIFAFADRLQSEHLEQESQADPVRLETWVTFDLAGEVFALPVEPIREVLRVASITRVPHAPDPIRGVTNVRGRVISVIDLRLRIGLQAKELDRSSRVIVVRSRGRRLGLLVDAVHHVIHIDLNRVQPPPEDVMTVQSDYIMGVYHLGEQLVLMLDVDRALVVQGPVPGRTSDSPEAARNPASRDSAAAAT